jgi:hypothetical protein
MVMDNGTLLYSTVLYSTLQFNIKHKSQVLHLADLLQLKIFFLYDLISQA